jgi:3-deoxy-D-manno-octulosonate 8-phosphate phosphatase (KDO 8-P phosphatase)
MNDQFIEEKAKEFAETLKNIKVCLFDCDGILTDRKIYWIGEEAGWVRSFNVQDGYGLKLLMRMGIKVGVVSGGASAGLRQRIQGLGLNYSYLGNEDKNQAYRDIRADAGVTNEEILYMGDELFDLPLLKACGFAVTVKHAPVEVRQACDLISSTPAGEGCAREVVEILRRVHAFEVPLDSID